MTEFEQNLRYRLRSGERNLSPAVEASLHASRQRALAQPKGVHLPRFLLPMAGMTLASIAAFFLVFSPLPGVNSLPKPNMGSEITDSQDLDFYYWLAETQGVADT